MLNFLGRLINVRQDEWRRLVILSMMAFMAILGITWAQLVIVASFVVQVGIDYLPYVFIGDALVIIVSTAIYSFFVDRFPHGRVFIGILTVSLLGIGAGSYLITSDQQTLGYVFLYLLFRGITDISSIHWGTYVNSFYDTRTAKRIIPVVSGVIRISIIVAGFSVGLLTTLDFGTLEIMGLWAVSQVVVILLVIITPLWAKQTLSHAETIMTSSQRLSYLANIREGFRFIRQSRYLQVMALASLTVMILLGLMNFRVLKTFEANLKTEQAIVSYTGQIVSLGSLLLLPVQFFFYNRLVTRMGVQYTNLIFPTISLMVVVVMLPFSDSTSVAALAFFNITMFNVVFRATTDELLYNAVPAKVKGRARAFNSGLVVPMGTMLAGVLTLLPVMSVDWFLPTLLGIFAALYVFAAVFVSRGYGKALISLLEQENYAFLLGGQANLIADSVTINYLKQQLDAAPDNATKIFIASVIKDLGSDDADLILEGLVRQGDSDLKAGIIDIWATSQSRSERFRNVCLDYLQSEDDRVRHSAITGLENELTTEQYLNIAVNLLDDPNLEVQLEVLPQILKSTHLDFLRQGEIVIQRFLQSPDRDMRIKGLEVIERMGGLDAIERLLIYLDDPDDLVRLKAITVIEEMTIVARLPKKLARSLLGLAPQLLDNSVERVRLAAIRIIEKLDDPGILELIAPALLDTSPRVRDEALRVFFEAGSSGVAYAEKLNQSHNISERNIGGAILVRFQPSKYETLAQTYIRENLIKIFNNYNRLIGLEKLSQFAGINILQGTIFEYSDELLDEIFYLIHARHSEATVVIIRESLQSESARVRANALEALEAFVSPRIAYLIAKILEPEYALSALAELGQEEFNLQVPNIKTVVRDLLSEQNKPWIRVAMAFTLGEVGKIIKEDQQRRAARASRTSVLSLLIGETPQEANPVDKFFDGEDKDLPFTLDEILVMLNSVIQDQQGEIRTAVRAAKRVIDGQTIIEAAYKEGTVLSSVERVIFLKGIPFFEGMTINQLKILANVCEEKIFPESTVIFDVGDPGGTLYVVVDGRVGIEHSSKATGQTARLATIEARSYFGEATLFDKEPSTTSAIALQDTLTLRLRHEPLVALMQQYPDMSLELIKVLSKHLQVMGEKVAELSRSMSRTMHRVYDKLE